MKLKQVITAVLLLSIFGMAVSFAIDSDTWWHLRAGQWMVENGEVIEADQFSYTRGGTTWQYPGVWVQVLMYLVFDSFGSGGLNIWTALMVVLVFGVVVLTTRGDPLLRAGLVLLSAVASATYWAARPYLVTYLLFALSFYLLKMYSRTGKKNIWLIAPTMLLWVNSHGGFLAGFILVGVYLFESLVLRLEGKWSDSPESGRKRAQPGELAGVTAAMFVVSLFNPHGWKAWALPFSTVSRQAEQLFIAEWQSPDFHDPWMLPFAVMVVLTILVLGASKSRPLLKDVLLLTGFGLLGLISVRNIFFFAIIWPGVMIERFEEVLAWLKQRYGIRKELDLSSEPDRGKKMMNWLIVFMVAAVVLVKGLSVFPASANEPVMAEKFPVEAVEYVRGLQPEGNIFNSYNFGGYLTWALPEYPVYVDGRADLYGDEIVLAWYRMINGSEEWKQEFERWDIGTVLLEPGVPMIEVLKLSGWEVSYQDQVAVVLTAP